MKYRFKKEKRKTRLLVLVLLVVIVLAVVVVHKVLDNKSYHNQRSFTKYVEKYYSDFTDKKSAKEQAAKAEFGKPVSTSVDLPKLPKLYKVKPYEDSVTKDLAAFKERYNNLSDHDKAAFMVGHESHQSPYHIKGMAVHQREYLEKSGKESIAGDKVMTYNFWGKSGIILTSQQIFKAGYLQKLTPKVNESLQSEYGKDKIDLKKVSADSNQLEQYILTKEGITFYFDAGKVAKKDAGALSVSLTYKELSGLLRKDLGKRVIDPNKPMVALTYDDGPDMKYTPQLLDIFEKYGQVATFFELGRNVRSIRTAPEILKRELDLGCQLGSHSDTHPNLRTLSDSQVKQEADKARESITKAAGAEPTIFRAPYGETSDKIAKTFGLSEINWTIDSLDWKTRNTQSIIKQVKGAKNFDGEVVLMHSLYKATVDASTELVPYLLDKGYQLVTVQELLQYKYGHSPDKVVNFGYRFKNEDKQ